MPPLSCVESGFHPLLFQESLSGASTATTTAADLPSGCDSFTWDVRHELTTLQPPASPISVSTSADNVMRIWLDTHYKARLYPQTEVTFAAAPGKPMLDADGSAGLLTFQVPRDGRYRAAITSRHSISLMVTRSFPAWISRDTAPARCCTRLSSLTFAPGVI